MKPKLLFVSCVPVGDSVSRYRCEHLADILNEGGFDAEVAFVGASRVRVAHDVVVLHRICDVAEGRHFLRAARRAGAMVLYGADDLVFDSQIPVEKGREKTLAFAQRHLNMMEQVDALLFSTEALVQHAEELLPGKPSYLQRNFLSEEQLVLAEGARKAAKKAESKVTFAYMSGTATHDADLASIAPALYRVLSEFAQVQLMLVGPVQLPAVLEGFGDRVLRKPYVPWRRLPGLIAQADVNLAPLALPDSFRDAKSEIKALEAAALAVPTVSSPSRGMMEAARQGMHVIFANELDEWEAVLTRLGHNSEVCQTEGAQARASLNQFGTFTAHQIPLTHLFDRFVAQATKIESREVTSVNFPFAPKYTLKAASKWLHKLVQ